MESKAKKRLSLDDFKKRNDERFPTDNPELISGGILGSCHDGYFFTDATVKVYTLFGYPVWTTYSYERE